MPGTTVYNVKVALKELLEQHDWDNDPPTIAWGQPTEGEDQAFDGVFFGNQPEFPITHRVLGHNRHDEEYRLPIVIDVRRYGDDEQATELRMWSIYDGVIDVLESNHNLDALKARFTDFTVRPGSAPAGNNIWRSQVVIDLGVVGLVFRS